jgi:hypothetical protein
VLFATCTHIIISLHRYMYCAVSRSVSLQNRGESGLAHHNNLLQPCNHTASRHGSTNQQAHCMWLESALGIPSVWCEKHSRLPNQPSVLCSEQITFVLANLACCCTSMHNRTRAQCKRHSIQKPQHTCTSQEAYHTCTQSSSPKLCPHSMCCSTQSNTDRPHTVCDGCITTRGARAVSLYVHIRSNTHVTVC